MLIKVKRANGTVLYFDTTRVLYVIERADGDNGVWPFEGTVAKVFLDSEARVEVLYFSERSWPGVRALLGIDTAVMVEAQPKQE